MIAIGAAPIADYNVTEDIKRECVNDIKITTRTVSECVI
jgi:hypothetical protein